MRTAPVALALLLLTTCTPLLAGSPKPPKQAVLDAVTVRGKMLADYDRAAEFASKAVREINPVESRVTRFIAIHDPSGWKVLFGRLDEKKTGFLVAYEAVSKDDSLKAFDVKTNDPPVSISGFPLNAARAMETALAKFPIDEQRAYNIAALPAEKGRIWVYIYPTQTIEDIWPIGGDARFLISSNGNKIVNARQLHATLIDVHAPPPGTTIEAGYHAATLEDVPEDTDVLYVLVRRPSVKEFVATRRFVYLIGPDGSIKFQGTREAFAKKGDLPR